MNVLSPLDEAIRELTHAQHLSRVKKLMVYACTQEWISDESRLATYHFFNLIQSLQAIAPTLSQLEDYLKQVVATLTKPAEYMLVANLIITHLHPIYRDQTGTSADLHADPPPELAERCFAVAQRLDRDSDRIRVKKLLVYLSQNHWENNPNHLDAFHLTDLVRDVYALSPSPAVLNAALESVVKTLNKQDDYRRVAQKITTAFSVLYPVETTIEPGDGTDHSQSLPHPIQPESHSLTHGVTLSPASGPIATGIKPPVPNPLQPPMPQRKLHPQPAAKPAPSSEPSPAEAIAPPLSTAEPPSAFDLRIEIMKYTNPLRAKILMFSALFGSIECCDRNWVVIKDRELDELLSDLLKTASSFEALETHLTQIARQSPESNQYLQATSAVLRAASAYYRSSAGSSKTPDHLLNYQPTQMRLGDATQAYLGDRPGVPSRPSQRRPSDDDDSTCQFYVEPIKTESDRASAPTPLSPSERSPETLFLPCSPPS